MHVVRIALEVFMVVITAWLSLSFLFQIFVSFWGFRKKTKDYEDHDPKLRFLVLVPAHNEEAVVQDIIENLKHMEYPKELYDFYILADNCTDQTASVSRQLGANVLEFNKQNENEPTGKSIVLKKAFERLVDYQKNYDVVMFFDADNLLDFNMFTEVNSQFLSHPHADIIQCYLGCKNNRGPVALFYYINYTIANRFLQYGRLRLSLNCGIGGTGFAVTTNYLHERGGWTAVSLTEDTELQFAATLGGRHVLWNHHVRVYDEKPTTWRASYRQRVRWAQGHWFVAFRNTKKLFSAIWHKQISPGEFFSTFMQMYFPCTYILAIFNLLVMLLHHYMVTPASELSFASFGQSLLSTFATIPAIVLFLYSLFVQFLWADVVDNSARFSLLLPFKVFFSFLLNSVLAGLAQIVGLFKYRQQDTWDKTDHRITRAEEDVLLSQTMVEASSRTDIPPSE